MPDEAPDLPTGASGNEGRRAGVLRRVREQDAIPVRSVKVLRDLQPAIMSWKAHGDSTHSLRGGYSGASMRTSQRAPAGAVTRALTDLPWAACGGPYVRP
jgi:hypothetical protein